MLLLEQRDSEQRDRLRDEELLTTAGFDANEIGRLLDKKPSAVRMTLSRARAKKG
jgi:DNA-directed RNA polymerase specialized sigma24 family protein